MTTTSVQGITREEHNQCDLRVILMSASSDLSQVWTAITQKFGFEYEVGGVSFSGGQHLKKGIIRRTRDCSQFVITCTTTQTDQGGQERGMRRIAEILGAEICSGMSGDWKVEMKFFLNNDADFDYPLNGKNFAELFVS